MSNVWFEMAVHDYNGYGQHTGHLHAAEFYALDGDAYLHLDCTNREIVCRKESVAQIRVGRQVFPFIKYSTYRGNMMWDGALVTAEIANKIAAILRRSGNYAPDDGTTDLWDSWEADKPLFSEADHA